jgi:hypothetical protein
MSFTAKQIENLNKLRWVQLPTRNFPAWKRVEIRECEHVHEFFENVAGNVLKQCQKCYQEWYVDNDPCWDRMDEREYLGY